MDKFLLWASACFLLRCQALQLTLDRKFPSILDRRPTCGVLLCVEESSTVANVTSSQVDGDDSYSPSRVARISSLKVFKFETRRSGTGSSTEGTDNRGILLATVNSEQSRVARVSDGIKVDGVLLADLATLRLKFVKLDDCRAEYVCQSQAVDIEGREVVSTSHLLQQPEKKEGWGYDLGWTPGTTGQVLGSVQQLDSKLAVLGSAIANWEEGMNRFKDRLENEMNSLSADLNAKTDRVEDKLNNLGESLNAQTDRLEDKLESLHKEAEAITNRFEDKLESMRNRLEDKINSIGANKPGGGLDSCKNETNELVKGQIRTGIASLGEEISTVKESLAELGTEIHQQLQALDREDKQVVKNLTQTSHNSACGIDRGLVDGLEQSFTVLRKTLEMEFKELSSNITTSAADTRAVINAQASRCNQASDGDIKSSFTELLTPTNCFRGMASTSSLAPSVYSVIQPGEGNNLSAPVLCDAFTDGGGWIVIQRRVNGDVNFYRVWEDYKRGFGSLDGDFWLGNDNIHAITSQGAFELRIDMRYKGNSVFAHYDSFSVGDEKSNYALHVAHYSGTAGDSILVHNGMAFSTHDKDNDSYSKNCAIAYVGAWWYKSCHASNLNGQWNAEVNRGPRWNSLSGAAPVSYTEMKVRRVIGIPS